MTVLLRGKPLLKKKPIPHNNDHKMIIILPSSLSHAWLWHLSFNIMYHLYYLFFKINLLMIIIFILISEFGPCYYSLKFVFSLTFAKRRWFISCLRKLLHWTVYTAKGTTDMHLGEILKGAGEKGVAVAVWSRELTGFFLHTVGGWVAWEQIETFFWKRTWIRKYTYWSPPLVPSTELLHPL